MKHMTCKDKVPEDDEDGALDDAPDCVQLLMSACLWMVIFAVYNYGNPFSLVYLGTPLGDSFAEAPHLQAVAASCWDKTLPSMVTNGTDEPDPITYHRSLPTVTLFAPCPLSTFVKVAKMYRKSVHEWRYVQTTSINSLVVQHHGEDPVTWRGGYEEEKMLLNKLIATAIPRVGQLVDFTSQFYGDIRKRGLVTLLPDPAMDGAAFDNTYRDMLLESQRRFGRSYDFTYMLSKMDMNWVASEFGVTSFPSLVVHKEFPGRPLVYSGEISQDSISLFLVDVAKGCADYKPHRLGAPVQKSESRVCDAAPVLADE